MHSTDESEERVVVPSKKDAGQQKNTETTTRQKFIRWHIDDFDFVKRTLFCQEIESSEVLTAEEPDIIEEAVSEEWQTDEDVTSEGEKRAHLARLLHCLKRKIQFIQLALRERKRKLHESYKEQPPTTGAPDAGADGDAGEEATSFSESQCLPCVQLMEVFALRKQHHQRQLEIGEMLRVLREFRCELRHMRHMGCKRVQLIGQLELVYDTLTQWRLMVEKEEHVCHKRYEFMQERTTDEDRVTNIFNFTKQCCKKHAINILPNVMYNVTRMELTNAINDLIATNVSTRVEIAERFANIEQELDLTAPIGEHESHYYEAVISMTGVSEFSSGQLSFKKNLAAHRQKKRKR